jgi:hypothetical protein
LRLFRSQNQGYEALGVSEALHERISQEVNDLIGRAFD